MIYIVALIGLGFIVLERLIPDQKLPHVKGWWTRVIIVNAIQLGVIFLGAHTWDKWLQQVSWFHLSDHMHPAAGGFIAYFIVTFVFYWWHRWRHDVNFLWLAFHQVHHSPQRIETITSFYKHPLEIICNSLIIGSINFLLLGLNLEAAAYTLLFSSVGEYIYHMNIKTPHWLGYFFQRPEMHRIHHQQGKHYNNFSDLPFWDMLFGTFSNPKTMDGKCGFKDERESQLLEMMTFKNVNNPYPPKK
ncbi:sterol desaturase family protein [Sanyastnella coralliicola]|uniref:sterol desaturase family protein n=1 Tax=Sanyastnella coralliicola TaxID=3069118 RepID=UPI0027B9D042|nr:sterol desaturase family protein [Longitalea sp. SCSIO 12813]